MSDMIKNIVREIAEDNKTVRGFLTPQEWAEASPPFYYIDINFPSWGTLEYEIAQKWIATRVAGWVYYSNKKFVFELEEDFVLFRLWASNEPMTGNSNTLAIT